MYQYGVRKILAVFILGLLCAAGIAEGGERDFKAGLSSGPDIDVTRLEKKIHALVNKEREKKGLSSLSWNENLRNVARDYSQKMNKRNFFSHYDPEGKSFCDRYKTAGFQCRLRIGDTTCLGAENIALNYLYNSSYIKDGETFFNWSTEDELAASVVKQWMGSKGHRENILTPYFKQQGIGVALSREGKIYVTENFC